MGVGILWGSPLPADSQHVAAAVGKQEARSASGDAPGTTETGAEGSASQRSDRRLYLGMWTYHFRWQESGIKRTPVLGLSRDGVFLGTFVNTYGKRSFAAGYHGELLGMDIGGLNLGLGFRVGAMTGYDERLHALAGKSPVFPLAQARVAADTRLGGFEVTYAGIIATGAVYLRF